MALVPITIPPGVFRSDTELESAGRWYDANLVRWYQTTMQPIGGWRKRSTEAVTGRASGAHSWRDNIQGRWIAVGTEQKLYVYQGGTLRDDITPAGYSTGRADATQGIGFGVQNYSDYGYGVARPDTSATGILPATSWALDNFGQYLVACANTDGKIYQWDLATATATVVTNAPTSNSSMMVTQERFLFALGAGGNPRKVQWCDIENITQWAPLATNQAGDFELQTSGTIIAGKRTRGGALILTTTDAHFARYLGPPYVYGFEPVGTGCGLVAANAVASVDAGAVWMGESGFWIFDGYVKPLDSEVSDFVYSDINISQASKISTLHNAEFGEVWWLYPSADSNENDRYVIWNYREMHWSIGTINRTVGITQGVFNLPMMISPDGYIYEHDVGYDYGGLLPFVESGPAQFGNGDNTLTATSMIPDERTQGDVQISFKTRYYPTSAESTFGPYTLSEPTDMRFSARQFKMRIEAVKNAPWRVGTMRIDAIEDGRR
jgi:hypothetical protein